MTILFLKDWNKWPGAVLDLSTANRSFIDMSLKLKSIGIKNHAFMLALYNPDLLGIDPHSENLTLAQKAAILVECKQNFWYQVRNVWKAPSLAGSSSKKSPILANRANLALWWSFFNHITFILTQPRQTGKSFCTDVLMEGLMNFMCEHTEFNLITKDDTLRMANIQRLKDIYEELPDYLKFKTRDDTNNTEAISIKKLDNLYLTHVAQASIKKAANTLRGQSTPMIQFDEPPFQTNINYSLPAAVAAMGAAAEQAKQNGAPYGLILTTTAGRKDDPSGKYIYDYAMDSSRWSERYYDAVDEVELEKLVRANSKKNVLRIYAPFSHRQVGKTDAWLKKMIEETNATADEADRDYFNVWTSGNDRSPLDLKVLERMNHSVADPLHQEIWSTGGYIVYWYLHEHEIQNHMANTFVSVGIDTSDAAGNDAISFVGTDIRDGSTLFTAEINLTNLIMVAQFFVEFLVKYTNTVFVIERRSSAITIIDYLFMFLPPRGIDPFTRIFNWVYNDPMEHKALFEKANVPMNRRDPEIYAIAKKHFGFATSGAGQTSRTELYSKTLISATKRCAELMRDRTLIEQTSSLVIRNGRIDHEEGAHDDMVIGYLLSHWFITMGKNLHMYGINSENIMAAHKQNVVKTPEEFLYDYKQQRIRQRIQELFTLLSSETNFVLSARYEAELKLLADQLILEANESFSIDAMMQEITKRKQALSNNNRQEYIGIRSNPYYR